MQAALLARWRWAGCGSLRGGGGSGGPVAALLPLALLLLLIGLPEGRPAAAQAPSRALLSPRRQPLPAPPSLEAALEAEALAEEAEALAEEAEEEEEAALGPLAAMAAAKRQQHQFDDYGHMRFGKRTPPSEATSQMQAQQPPAPQRTVFRRRPPTQTQASLLQQRVRKFDDYGHMRFGRSSEK